MIKLISFACVLAAAFLCACSKHDSGAPEAAAVASSRPTKADPIVESALKDLDQKIQNQQYDAAVGGLVSLKDFPKTQQEQQAFERQLNATINALGQRAAQGDQAARQGQQMLGRMMTGR